MSACVIRRRACTALPLLDQLLSATWSSLTAPARGTIVGSRIGYVLFLPAVNPASRSRKSKHRFAYSPAGGTAAARGRCRTPGARPRISPPWFGHPGRDRRRDRTADGNLCRAVANPRNDLCMADAFQDERRSAPASRANPCLGPCSYALEPGPRGGSDPCPLCCVRCAAGFGDLRPCRVHARAGGLGLW